MMNSDINPVSTDIEEQYRNLIDYIKTGSIEQAERILRGDSQQLLANKLQSKFRQAPLYFAALAGSDDYSAQMIKLLLRYGANARFKDHNEQTILFYLCRQGKEKSTEILLTHGLSLDQVDVYGQTPLFYAISENKIEIARKYATRCTSAIKEERLNHVDKLMGQTPLYYAARRGHLELCKLLVQKGANVDHLDSTNKTAIQYAKKAKFSEVAEFLTNQLRKSKDPKFLSAEQGVKKVDCSKQGKQTYKIAFYNEKGEAHDLTEQEAFKLIQTIPQIKQYLLRPDDISDEKLLIAQGQTWQKLALKVVNGCCKIKGSFYFMQPVDPVKFNILDYFDVISKPMDLGTIKRRLSHNYYLSAQQFVEDMQLLWQNSYRYNGQTHMVSKAGKELELSFKDLINSTGLTKYL